VDDDCLLTFAGRGTFSGVGAGIEYSRSEADGSRRSLSPMVSGRGRWVSGTFKTEAVHLARNRGETKAIKATVGLPVACNTME